MKPFRVSLLEYTPLSTLYHYCGTGSFDGITTSREVWLNDLRHLNDPKELQLATVFKQVIGELIVDRATDVDLLPKLIWLQTRLESLQSRFGMYSFSLSLVSDQLPMWQEYTERGSGYCIGFRPTAFNHMTLRIQRARYVDPSYMSSLYDLVTDIAARLDVSGSDPISEFEPVLDLLMLVTAVKDQSWRHEDEVRLIFSNMTQRSDFPAGATWPVGLLPDGTEVEFTEPRKRMKGDVEIPYFAQSFGRYRQGKWDASKAISHVIIGPNNKVDDSAVTALLHSRGFVDFEVLRSACRFRP